MKRDRLDRTTTLVDLSQPYFNEMSTSRAHGVPSFTTKRLDPAEIDGIVITHMAMSTHMGTHVDAPRHFLPDGRTIDEYPVERFRGPGIVLDVRRDGPVAITADDIRALGADLRQGDIVLFCTGWGERFGTPEYGEHPHLSEDAADLMVDLEAGMVGIDALTPDQPDHHREPGFAWPVHHRLLSNDVLIIENLGPRLGDVAGRRVDVSAVPLAIRGSDGAPARVTASLER
jgi:arylformamidase